LTRFNTFRKNVHTHLSRYFGDVLHTNGSDETKSEREFDKLVFRSSTSCKCKLLKKLLKLLNWNVKCKTYTLCAHLAERVVVERVFQFARQMRRSLLSRWRKKNRVVWR